MTVGRISGRRSRAPAGQNEIIVARASSAAELRTITPNVATIPEGVRGRVIIEGPFIGPLADLAFAEITWGNAFAPTGAEVIDVFGDGLNKAVIEYRIPVGGSAAQGFARQGLIVTATVLLVSIAAAAIAIGWAIRQITVLFFGAEDGASAVTGVFRLAAVAGLIGGAILLTASVKNTRSPGAR